MKLLVVIGLVALLLLLLYRRLRPYLKFTRELLNTIRHFRNVSGTRVEPHNQNPQTEKLVCCQGCGIWIPAGRALTGGSSGSIFCSADCMSGHTRGKRRPTTVRS